MQNIQGGCTAPTGWGLHWLTAFPAQNDQWNQSRGSAYNSEDWRGRRVKLIPPNSGLPGITPICFYRMKITLCHCTLQSLASKKEGGALHSEEILRGLLFSSSGAHSSRSPLRSLPSLRTHSAIWRGTYISRHLETYRQMGKPALPSACFTGRDVMEAYPDSPRLRKDRNKLFFSPPSKFRLCANEECPLATACQVYFMLDFSILIQPALLSVLKL